MVTDILIDGKNPTSLQEGDSIIYDFEGNTLKFTRNAQPLYLYPIVDDKALLHVKGKDDAVALIYIIATVAGFSCEFDKVPGRRDSLIVFHLTKKTP